MEWYFYNVSKKYNFDNLSQSDIEALIEDKCKRILIRSYNGKRKGFWLKPLGTSVITKGK
jgi:DNA topoisomerase-1